MGDRVTRGKQGTNLAREARLTKAELESWASYTATAWAPFKDAWLRRGLHYAPSTAQRGLLWEIADARPRDLGRWVSEAPVPRADLIVAYILDRWDTLRNDTEARLDAEDIARPSPRAGTEQDAAALDYLGLVR